MDVDVKSIPSSPRGAAQSLSQYTSPKLSSVGSHSHLPSPRSLNSPNSSMPMSPSSKVSHLVSPMNSPSGFRVFSSHDDSDQPMFVQQPVEITMTVARRRWMYVRDLVLSGRWKEFLLYPENTNAGIGSDAEEDEDDEQEEEEEQRVLKVKKYGPLAPQDPLIKACKRGDTTAIKNIIANYDVDYDVAAYLNASDTNGSHSIFHTVWPGHHAALELLLKHRADPNKLNNRLNTALHLACERTNKKIVTLLIHYGAKTDVENSKKLLCYQCCYTPDEQLAMKSLVDRLVVAREGGYQVDNTILRPPKNSDFTPFNPDFYTFRRKKEYELAIAVARGRECPHYGRAYVPHHPLGGSATVSRPVGHGQGTWSRELVLPVVNRGGTARATTAAGTGTGVGVGIAAGETGSIARLRSSQRHSDTRWENSVSGRPISGIFRQRPVSRAASLGKYGNTGDFSTSNDHLPPTAHVTTWVRAMAQVRPSSGKNTFSDQFGIFSRSIASNDTFLDPLPVPVGPPNTQHIADQIRNSENTIFPEDATIPDVSTRRLSSSPLRRSRPQTTTGIHTSGTSSGNTNTLPRIPTFRTSTVSRGIPSTATKVEAALPWEHVPGQRAKTAGWYNPRQNGAVGGGYAYGGGGSARGSARSSARGDGEDQIIDWTQIRRELGVGNGNSEADDHNSGQSIGGSGDPPSSACMGTGTGKGSDIAGKDGILGGKRVSMDIRKVIQCDNKRHLYRYYYRGQYEEEPIPEFIVNAGKDQGKKGKDHRKNDSETSVYARNRRLFSPTKKNALVASLQSIGRGLMYLRAPIIKHKLLKRLQRWRQKSRNEAPHTKGADSGRSSSCFSSPGSANNNSSLTELNSNSLLSIPLGLRVRGHRRASETLRQDLAKLEMVIRTMQAGRRMAPPPLPLLRDVWSCVDGEHDITPLLGNEEDIEPGKNDASTSFSGQNVPGPLERSVRAENVYLMHKLGVGAVVDVYASDEEEEQLEENTEDLEKVTFSQKKPPSAASKPVYASLSSYVQAEEEKQRRKQRRLQQSLSRSRSRARTVSPRKTRPEEALVSGNSGNPDSFPKEISSQERSSLLHGVSSLDSDEHGAKQGAGYNGGLNDGIFPLKTSSSPLPSRSLRLAMEAARKERTAINVTGRRNAQTPLELQDLSQRPYSVRGDDNYDNSDGKLYDRSVSERGTTSFFSNVLARGASQPQTLMSLQAILDATPQQPGTRNSKFSENVRKPGGAVPWIMRDSEGNNIPPPNTLHTTVHTREIHSTSHQRNSQQTQKHSQRHSTLTAAPISSSSTSTSTSAAAIPNVRPLSSNYDLEQPQVWQAFASRTDLPAHVREHATKHAWALSQRRSAHTQGSFPTGTQGSLGPAYKAAPRQGALAQGLESQYRYVHGPLRTNIGMEHGGSATGTTILSSASTTTSMSITTSMSATSMLASCPPTAIASLAANVRVQHDTAQVHVDLTNRVSRERVCEQGSTVGTIGFSTVVSSIPTNIRNTGGTSTHKSLPHRDSTTHWRQCDDNQRQQTAKIHAANDRRTEWLRRKARKGREDDRFLKAIQNRL